MLRKETERPRPRSVRRVFAVIARAEVGEGVSSIGIGMKFMRLAETSQLSIEFLHVRRRRILIVFAEVTHNRTVNILRPLEWRWAIAPGVEWIATVVHDTGLDIRIHRRHEIHRAPAHAESNDADLRRVHRLVRLQIAYRLVNIGYHG